MADISAIKTPDDTTYLIKDFISRQDIFTLKNTLQKSVSEISGGAPLMDWIYGEYYSVTSSVTSITIGDTLANDNYACMVVPCQENDVFTYTATGGSGAKAWVWINSSGSILSRSESSVICDRTTLIAPTDAAYLIVNADTRHEMFLVRGDGVITDDYIRTLNDKIDKFLFVFSFTPNLVWTDGYYISNTNGTEVSYSNWKGSNYVRIDEDAIVTTTTTASNSKQYNAFYDKDKQFIESFTNNNGTLTIPSGAKYLRLSCRTSESNTVSIAFAD